MAEVNANTFWPLLNAFSDRTPKLGGRAVPLPAAGPRGRRPETRRSRPYTIVDASDLAL